MSLAQRTNGSSLDVPLDHEAILRSLNLNPRDPKTQALLLVCDRYDLDPVMKHMVLISGNPYVTRDGLLHVAHRSGQFDGMEVIDTGEYETHYWAKVGVYRKDMGRPFTFVGRFSKSKQMAKEYGPEMAIKVAEVAALRRAFPVTGLPAAIDASSAVEPSDEEQQTIGERRQELLGGPQVAATVVESPGVVLASDEQREALKARLTAIQKADVSVATELAREWKANGITAFGAVNSFTAADAEAVEGMVMEAERRLASKTAAEVAEALSDAPLPSLVMSVGKVKARCEALDPEQVKVYASEAKGLKIPTVSKPALWNAELVVMANGLLDEITGTGAASQDPTLPLDGTEPFETATA